MSKKRNIKVGQIYLITTSAAVNILAKIIKINESRAGWYTGVLVTENDRRSLINQQVAVSKDLPLEECEFWVDESEIIKRVYNKKNQGTINSTSRKTKRRVYDPNSRKNSK